MNLRFIILQNTKRPFAIKTAKEIKIFCKKNHIDVQLIDSLGCVCTKDITKGAADIIIACGGDGSILEAANRSFGSGIPIAGVNAGYLGYLSAFSSKSKQEFLKGLQDLKCGEFHIEKRYVVESEGHWAMNDLVISRGHNPIGEFELTINGHPATFYRGDGLIIATATGSTAYSLAAGGPILTGSNQSLVVTPICPHSLANRSVVVSKEDKIAIKIAKGAHPYTFSVDGNESVIWPNKPINVQISKRFVPLINLKTTNRLAILSEKLGWKPTPV